MISRFLPLAAIVAIAVIGGIVRPLVHRARYGAFGVHFLSSSSGAQLVRDGLFVLVFVALIAQGFQAARHAAPLPSEVISNAALRDVLAAAGIALIFAGLIVFAAAELNLGASWRVGIEESAKPGLVTSGLYAYSRNPIYLGILTILTGYTALVPTWLSIAVLAGTYVGLRFQIAAEEDYLTRSYGQAFLNYARRVGRFLPWLGRR
jgi:protein-S-isoprenylcysteine O-methyltransferase Ste14